ncbi:uncharacterized protein MONOS_11923 [Monocercomonoides exilis]|uniref:uncharacterized protein n=1 Tax=Monocercomonoides exilis TaxID=2049356 RepID=UPI003559E893|nr:hypothetical protein MONOS_11923 [Monocercomonoides exilis]|eukprot:MONOS_11923.1-p1 / transcript=MONOS_11923.1 / gene=MONOS_11923 / organism=Monocercomonoides_exilis_PA203 / gene_product=unspecified product / transcript_product=unspecified product / location=Mono_scaffold00626:1983-3170(-) / protein_length=395 / sequence_SO=supercontig / SO=protein_coding / is_pseudo=false
MTTQVEPADELPCVSLPPALVAKPKILVRPKDLDKGIKIVKESAIVPSPSPSPSPQVSNSESPGTSIDERQERYKQARARIFGDQGKQSSQAGISKDSPSSNEATASDLRCASVSQSITPLSSPSNSSISTSPTSPSIVSESLSSSSPNTSTILPIPTYNPCYSHLIPGITSTPHAPPPLPRPIPAPLLLPQSRPVHQPSPRPTPQPKPLYGIQAQAGPSYVQPLQTPYQTPFFSPYPSPQFFPRQLPYQHSSTQPLYNPRQTSLYPSQMQSGYAIGGRGMGYVGSMSLGSSAGMSGASGIYGSAGSYGGGYGTGGYGLLDGGLDEMNGYTEFGSCVGGTQGYGSYGGWSMMPTIGSESLSGGGMGGFGSSGSGGSMVVGEGGSEMGIGGSLGGI